jgi:ribonuclease HII
MLRCDLGSLYLECKGMCVDWLGLEQEREIWAAGYRWLAGLDEVGRGAWAGPVVAAAVVLPPERNDMDSLLHGVHDSKALTPRQREALLPLILQTALGVGVGMASSRFIDRWGIVPATRQAMAMAVRNLPLEPHYLLIDAVKLPDVHLPQRNLIKGDVHVLSIAAASIVAKVFRDRLMVALGSRYCDYGFAAHKGYGTAAHRAALQRLGPCAEHRLSFAPLRALVSAAR